jgi:ferrous iron transport protein B
MIAARSLVPACQQLIDPGAALAAPGKPIPLSYETPKHLPLTERVDRIVMHRVWGLVIFAAVMTLLFVAIFSLAQPIMNGIGDLIAWLGEVSTRHLADGPLKDLINNGIFAGVGTVVVFLPQIALLFFFLAILEDSGYLARAAFLMDRLLAKVGLHGKSFIPLLSSFACCIPGIMATRTIENRKDRLATILIAPFMSCSARLPVYTLLIGACFIHYGPLAQAGVMFACYSLGIVAAVATALVFKRTFLKGMPSSFILEMPTYKFPQASIVARQVWSNASQFLVKAGTTIFAMSVILWALAYYPRLPAAQADKIRAEVLAIARDPGSRDNAAPAEPQEASDMADNAVDAAQSEFSFAGRFGHAIEPVIRPLGFDWKMGVGLVAAFAARETFVSTEGIVYATGDTDKTGTKSLATAMQNAKYANGRPVWTPLVAVSLLIWFVLAMQCMSTIAIVRRETGGWSWPIFMTLYMNGLAYVICLLVFQVGHFLGA